VIEIEDPLKSFEEFPGPILLLAGPGTGKTYQLAKRVKFLIEDKKADPEEITIITFTNEAARNMRERLAQSDIGIPPEKIPETILTMHSLGNTIIGTRPEIFGLPAKYGVMTEDYQKTVLLKDAAVLAGFEREKWKLAGDCRLKGACNEDTGTETCQICIQYRLILRKCLCLDYDEQILLACSALINDPDLKNQWQAKTRYLLVDEYQDINQAQCDLIKLLTDGQEEGLFAVGDDDQSIYSFRGGSPKYICDFEKYFGENAKIGRLAKSWRCPKHILKGARSMVTNFYKDSVSKPEPTFGEKAQSDTKIFCYDVPTERWEANLIAKIAEDNIKTNSITIIIPNGKYFPPIRDALKWRRLPYNYKSKINTQGITRITLLAEWAENKDDNLVLRQLIELVIENHDELTKKLPITDTTITKRRESASKEIASLWNEVNESISLWQAICKKTNESEFFAILKKDCLDEIITILDDKISGKRSSLPKFMQNSALFVAPGKNPKGLIEEIREWKNDRIAASINTSIPPVSIYNMPSSKGLEAEIVLVVGASEELIPSAKGDVQEESRLFFVAMTRAKKELHLFSARKRPADITFHPESYQFAKSSFIDAIPKEHIDIRWIDAKNKKQRKST
jgi:DNA helicase II / ATP-dependent DNA helicase PcrA